MSPPAMRLVVDSSADDAAVWLLRRDEGLDVERDPAFLAWRDLAAANAAAWAHATTIWDASDRPVSDSPLLAALRRDALQARPPRAPAMAAAAAAAAAVVMIAGALLAWPQIEPRPAHPTAQPGPAADAAATFANASGPPNSFALADGSRVTLNADSAVAVAYDGRRRAVRLLRGQAYFAVAHDADRPFTVAAGPRTVTDLGTEFDVRLGGQAVTVTLIKGAVAISPVRGGRATKLSSPGQQLAAAAGRADAVAQVDLSQALSWRTRMLEFSGLPLAQAIAEVNRYGGPPARVTDAAVASLPVSGRFRAGDPTRFANTLAAAYPLSVHARADGGVDIARR